MTINVLKYLAFLYVHEAFDRVTYFCVIQKNVCEAVQRFHVLLLMRCITVISIYENLIKYTYRYHS